MNHPLLLDTCAIIYLSTGEQITPDAEKALENALSTNDVCVSTISAWEIGRAMSLGRIASILDPLPFFRRFMSQDGISERLLTDEILVQSSYLPGELHRDPMDRILIATAREHDLTIVTRDKAILTYGEQGYVRTLSC